jgi:hypothetical protein
LDGTVGQRVGGGRSWHLATEGLRVAGGEFYPDDLGADFPNTGDLVWGTLVTIISCSNNNWSDAAPDAAVQPGDVIQYCGSAVIGNQVYHRHFTSIVRTINDANRPTSVYQQSLNGVNVVGIADIDTTLLTAGSLFIYRPIARTDSPNVWKFTVVNNTTTSFTYDVMVDITTVKAVSSAPGSLQAHKIETDGTVPAIVADIAYIYVENAKGNGISASPFTLRQLSP